MQERARHSESQIRNQTGRGISRIENHESGSCLENTKQSDDKSRTSLRVNRDDVFWFNPLGDQIIGKLISALIQFTITPTTIRIDDRWKIRHPLSLLSDQLVDRSFPGIIERFSGVGNSRNRCWRD